MEEAKIEKDIDINAQNKDKNSNSFNILNRVNALKIKSLSGEIIEKESSEENKYNLQTEEDDIDEFESDEEKDSPNEEPLSKEDNYTINNILVRKYTFKELSQYQLLKINALKALTEDTISKTVKNKNNANLVKALVSKKKNRFCYD